MSTIQDYAQIHTPLTDLFDQPRTPEQWRKCALSHEQVEHFKEYGYIKDVRIIDDAKVDRLIEELAQLAQPSEASKDLFMHYQSNEADDPSKVLFHAIGGWRIAPHFHDLWWSPVYRMACWQLLGGPVRLFHDQLFCKPAHHGGVVAWHQDYSYWQFTAPMQHLTCWIGLDDANVENGCMWYVPGSHRWPLLPVTGLAGDMDAVRQVLNAEQIESFDKRVPIEMRRGCASFHHPLTMHGSYENRSARQRRAVVLNSMRDGTLSNRDADKRVDLLHGFPNIPQGEPMDGPLFPVLFDPARMLGDLAREVPTIRTV